MKMIKITFTNGFRLSFSILLVVISFLASSSCYVNKNTRDAGSVKETPSTVLSLIPSEGNPRNSEGDFINLKDGRIMFIYSHYTGSSTSDHAPAYLAARYSFDKGRTWTEEDEIILENEGVMNVMSVSLLRLQNGTIALFYLRKNSIEDCIPMMRISNDEGQTWSDTHACITDKQGYFVLNNDRVIQLEDGRLLMPVALHKVHNGEWQDIAELYCYYSDDSGKTWISSLQVPNKTDLITQEPGLIEMKDGRIMMYIRASGGFQQLSFSSDNGESWSHIEQSNIHSPLSPATIEKILDTNDWLLVWNNNDGSNSETKNKRTPLTIAISKDEGKSWEKIKNIEDNTDGWYCYISIHFVDNDKILLGYCAGSQSKNTHLSVTDIRSLTKEWLYK